MWIKPGTLYWQSPSVFHALNKIKFIKISIFYSLHVICIYIYDNISMHIWTVHVHGCSGWDWFQASISVHVSLWDRVSHRTWISLIQPVWLVRKFQRGTVFARSDRVRSYMAYSWFFMAAGDRNSVLCAELNEPACLLGPYFLKYKKCTPWNKSRMWYYEYLKFYFNKLLKPSPVLTCISHSAAYER